ncbi:carboxymuconolactone decarboxylase family protein [Maritalea porphyrae]|jgi:AhpD family alkylhydroperoxidase|uniref:carboxymuconolactone decarboxylase family protein n=1 Tax=Maritalea porphyrae TaxID=880732 RepID=UPI0022AFB32C|nr:carboxymuconolactone decarboxylase family protein [Maritalea porphyrae]MCZ4271668.1 carboxymuconolactone decarboxylase family protein [Maritalea porphyrae]
MTTTFEDGSAPIVHEQVDPQLIGHLGQVHPMMAERGLGAGLSALIELRISQINQCAYCVNLHIVEARKAGIEQEKLDKLVVWQHFDVFSPAEKAVLAWAEALTYLIDGTNYASLRANLRAHFSDKNITAITTDIGMINLWNRIQISKH